MEHPAIRSPSCGTPCADGWRCRTEAELNDAGFTLIELIITVTILPIVVGAIAVALISVLNLQGGTSNRISDSNDALVNSSVFNKDVESAQEIHGHHACLRIDRTAARRPQWAKIRLEPTRPSSPTW